jgi:hypothetical protein
MATQPTFPHLAHSSSATVTQTPPQQAASVDAAPGSGNDGGMDDVWRAKVDERLGGLERAIEGMKEAVISLRWMTTILVSLGIAATLYTLTRVDSLATLVRSEATATREEMARSRGEFLATANAIANSITATKQQPPQVILVPTPQIIPPPAPVSPQK